MILVRPIRPATAMDLAAVAALVDAAYAHYIPIIGRRPRPMDDDHGARLARGELFVLEDGIGILGVMTMYAVDDAVHIFNLAIRPDAQGRGLLRHLILAEDAARARGLAKLTLFTNVAMTANRAIYAHLGFVELREEVTPDGYEIVFMERLLARALSP